MWLHFLMFKKMRAVIGTDHGPAKAKGKLISPRDSRSHQRRDLDRADAEV
jgi:hypothetical protein